MGAFVSRASQTTMGVLVLLAIGGVGVYVLFSAAERRATSAIGSLVTNAPQIASSVAQTAQILQSPPVQSGMSTVGSFLRGAAPVAIEGAEAAAFLA